VEDYFSLLDSDFPFFVFPLASTCLSSRCAALSFCRTLGSSSFTALRMSDEPAARPYFSIYGTMEPRFSTTMST